MEILGNAIVACMIGVISGCVLAELFDNISKINKFIIALAVGCLIRVATFDIVVTKLHIISFALGLVVTVSMLAIAKAAGKGE